MELEHAVVTSVNRDDLPDGGASIYAETIRRIRDLVPGCSVEVLIPDFKGDEGALRAVLDARPTILGHNLETVARLHPDVRPGGRYWRSISYLGASKQMEPDIVTKTALILGMGEEPGEIRQAMRDLRDAAVDILTLGQYLRPSLLHIPVARWVTPEEFAQWKEVGERELGFQHVEAGPLVRSSYHAKEQAREVEPGEPGRVREVREVGLTVGGAEVGRGGVAHARADRRRAVRLARLGSLTWPIRTLKRRRKRRWRRKVSLGRPPAPITERGRPGREGAIH